MPRELVHWHVLDRTIALVSADAPHISSLLSRYRESAELGAMAHDAPYYLRFGKDSFERTAEFLHGSRGEDTFDPLRSLAGKITCVDSSSFQDLQWAFLLGMVTHAITDAHFHPMVYYFTGDYGDPMLTRRRDARTRHRLFETYLDRYFEVRYPSSRPRDLSYRVKALTESLPELARWLGESICISGDEHSDQDRGALWEESLRTMARLQSVFLSTPLGVVVRVVNRLTGGSLGEVDALFFYGRSPDPSLFDNPLTFQNPLDGAKEELSVQTLAERAIAECAEIFRRTEATPPTKTPSTTLLAPFSGIQGRSLNIGRYRVPTSGLRYFAEQGFPLPGLKVVP